jgi:hypothetical protein
MRLGGEQALSAAAQRRGIRYFGIGFIDKGIWGT